MSNTHPSHFSTIVEIAEHYGVTRQTVYRWKALDMLGRKTKAGYHRETVCNNIDNYLKERDEPQPGHGDREEKIRLECERLRVVIDKERELLEQQRIETRRQQGKLMTVQEHDSICDAYMHLYLGSLDQLVENVATKTRSAKVRTILRDAVDSVRAKIAAMGAQ